MSIKRIYVAGRVNNLPIDQVREKFNKAAAQIAATAAALKQTVIVVNPVWEIERINEWRVLEDDEPLTDAHHRKEIMGACLYLLSTCDELHLMPCYTSSAGAQLERDFALRTGIKLVHI